MSGAWEAGDVALVKNEHGVWNVAIMAIDTVRRMAWRYGVADAWMSPKADARPLAVIDPDDRAQIEQLRDVFVVHYLGQTGYTATDRSAIANAMQAALREWAAPTPKVEEPTGFGAVVEDRTGDRWVRSHPGAKPWTRPHLSGTYSFAEVCAVRVLSHGVSDNPADPWNHVPAGGKS